MSVCIFIAADCELQVKLFSSDDHFIEINEGTVFDGDKDDEYELYEFRDVASYSELHNGVELLWNYWTPGRAREIIEYIKTALEKCDAVELGKVWLMDYYDYDERPYYQRREISISELTSDDIKSITEADVWGKGEMRPVYYSLRVHR